MHRTEVFELIQYDETATKVHRRPLVVIPPQINKYYITDLAPGRSLVESIAAGLPYFTLSWHNPTPEHPRLEPRHLRRRVPRSDQVACDIAGSDDANVAGVCAGGVTLAALLGHLAATGESSLVNSVTFLVAGLDTTTETTASNLMSRTPSRRPGEAIASGGCARRRGHGPGLRLAATERPRVELLGQQLPHGPQPAGVRHPVLEQRHGTRLPAGLHSDFLDLYLTNGLVEGTLEVLGTPVDLGKVSCDSFVVAGHTDHLIPWDGAYRTTQLLGGESQFVLSNGGHIQAILNPPDNPKASYFTSESLPATAAMARRRHAGDRVVVDAVARVAAALRHRGRDARVPATPPTRRWNPHPGATSTCSAGLHLRPSTGTSCGCRSAVTAGPSS